MRRRRSREEGRHIRVLLADDEADLRFVVRRHLSRSPRFAVVAEAADGREAIALAREHQPDVVLLDLAMPGLDGREAVIPLTVACPRTMVVIFTVLPAREYESDTRARGAFAYLEKSILDAGDLATELAALHELFARVLEGQDQHAPISVAGAPTPGGT